MVAPLRLYRGLIRLLRVSVGAAIMSPHDNISYLPVTSALIPELFMAEACELRTMPIPPF